MLTDIRYAIRSLTRRPGFAILAVATLGLGIGANTTIFSALYRLNYEQLPYETADRLVTLARTQAGEGFLLSPSPAVVAAWAEQSRLLEDVAFAVPVDMTLTGRGEPVALNGARLTAGLPEMLREKPVLGRMFTEAEAVAEAPVVVLSAELWRERFGGDRGVIGQSAQLGGQRRTVIGVMSDDFGRYSDPYPRQEFWVPYRVREEDSYGSALGLLREGATPQEAGQEMERIAAGFGGGAPAGPWTYTALPIAELIGDGTRQTFPILLGAVALVLLIAVANVAGLMIVRLNARRREIAIRAALGGRHRRILGGLVVEQVLLAFAAGIVGLLLAAWSISIIAHFAPHTLPLLDSLRLEPAVLLFATALLLLSTFFAGVLPAWSALRGDPADSLRSGGERFTSGSRGRSVLVSAQIALSVVLLVGAVLLIRSFGALQSRDLGFNVNGAVVIDIALSSEGYDADQKGPFFTDVLDGIRAIPGVTTAAVGGDVPPHVGLLFGTLRVDDSDVSTDGISYVAGTVAAPGFLPALGVRFSAGRDFNEADSGMNRVIVSRSFVERFWPGDDGVGRRLKLANAADAPWNEIVGVIEDISASHSPTGENLQVFYPQEWSYPTHSIIVRTDRAEPLSLVPAIRQLVSRSDDELPLRNVSTLEQLMSESIARERFNMVLLSLFAGIAIVLSVVGLYGLVAYTVQQRVREIAIGVALGATTASVRSLFLKHGMRLVGAGLLAGIAVALVAVRVLR
ncbi:MAG TPA: ADOP family duplicated permease, partial [Longimicrobiales bacterium]|nr:ADOP family duplicated permease [Longimicrobiales bacterium]